MRSFRALLAASLAFPAPVMGSEDEYGIDSLAVGDFDGDRTPDVAVGMPMLGSGKLKEAGEIRIFSGKTGSLLRRILGKAKEESRGRALEAVGDVDGDGATDLASGICCEASLDTSPDVLLPSGKVEILSGRTGLPIYVYGPPGPETLSSFGDEIGALGDGTGLAKVDIVVHDRMRNKWTCFRTEKRKQGWGVSDEAGRVTRMTGVGDVNGDGTGDIAIGLYLEDANGLKGAGRLQVVSGAYLQDGKGSVNLHVLEGTIPHESLGLNVGPAEDWNGDGKGDLLIGRSGSDGPKGYPWLVRVLSGADAAELWKAEGPPKDFSHSGAVAVGDLDGDGRPEVAVGVPGRSRKAGAVVLISSKDGTPLWTVDGVAGEMLGYEVYRSPDANGDGCADIVAQAPAARADGKKGKGRVRILSGKDGKTLVLINPLDTK